jgi:hypothetical protein
MTYEEFVKFVQFKCMHETIYEDSDGRSILVIKLLDAYSMVTKLSDADLVMAERDACAKICEAQAQDQKISSRRRLDADYLAWEIRDRGRK